MQLTIEVLPAPFGPMMENSSPLRTWKLTSVSAWTPPKRRETPRDSNMGVSGLGAVASVMAGPAAW